MQEGFLGPYNQRWEVLCDTSEVGHRYTVSGQIMTAARFPYAPSIPLRRVIGALHSSPPSPLFSPIQPRFPNRSTIIFSLLTRARFAWRGESVGLCEVAYS